MLSFRIDYCKDSDITTCTAGYTEDYLIRPFKSHYGVTPHRYLIGRRMDHARWLLENTTLSTEQIASAVGYPDFSVFYRAFCNVHGASPGTFRKH